MLSAKRVTNVTGKTWLLLAAAIVALDQVTKTWAVRSLNTPRWIIENDVGFQLAFNSGGAFSLLNGFTPLLAAIAVVVAILLVRAIESTKSRLALFGYALILGGAVGNLSDRIFREPGFFRGEVVDLIKIYGWPTFNLADSAITVGVACIFLYSLRTHE